MVLVMINLTLIPTYSNLYYKYHSSFESGFLGISVPINITCLCTSEGALRFCATDIQWETWKDDKFIKDYIKYPCD